MSPDLQGPPTEKELCDPVLASTHTCSPGRVGVAKVRSKKGCAQRKVQSS